MNWCTDEVLTERLTRQIPVPVLDVPGARVWDSVFLPTESPRPGLSDS